MAETRKELYWCPDCGRKQLTFEKFMKMKKGMKGLFRCKVCDTEYLKKDGVRNPNQQECWIKIIKVTN